MYSYATHQLLQFSSRIMDKYGLILSNNKIIQTHKQNISSLIISNNYFILLFIEIEYKNIFIYIKDIKVLTITIVH